MATSTRAIVSTLFASTLLAASWPAAAAPSDPTGRPAELPGSSTSSPPGDELATETLFRGNVTHGGYGAPETKVTAVLGSPAMLVGAQGGWIVNHHFVLGIAGYGLATRHDTPVAMRVDGDPSSFEMGYGGLRVGYMLAPHRFVHLGFGLLVGAGGLVARSREESLVIDEDGNRDFTFRSAHAEAFFALEPQVEVETNLTTFMRLALNGSYRYIAAVQAPGLSNADVSAPAAGLALKFGMF